MYEGESSKERKVDALDAAVTGERARVGEGAAAVDAHVRALAGAA